MAVPTHNSSCSTRAFPIKCRLCNEEVFFFFCTCGSKVLFDSLGSPWPIHRCTEGESSDIIDTLSDHYGVINQSVLNHLIKIAENRSRELPAATIDIIRRHINKVNKNFEKRHVQAELNNTTVSGEVLNINRDVNFYKIFGLVNNDISKQLLSILGKESFSEMTIRTHVDFNNRCEEYSVYIASNVLKKIKLKLKEIITVHLIPYEFIGGKRIWLVQYISIIN